MNQYAEIAVSNSTVNLSPLSFNPSFDLDGNQTTIQTSTGIWFVEYNAENRPVLWDNGDGTVIAMTYDHQGRRINKTVSDPANNYKLTTINYLYDGFLQIAVFETASDTNSITTTFWDPTEPIATRPLCMSYTGDSSQLETINYKLHTFFYTHDLTKNITALIDTNATIVASYDYDAFGTPSITTPNSSLPTPNFENSFLFSSEYHDSELGLHYYNYRHYNPLDGRWTNRDPMEEKGGFNLYVFVENTTLNLTDRLGLRIGPFPPGLGVGITPEGVVDLAGHLIGVKDCCPIEAIDTYNACVSNANQVNAKCLGDAKTVLDAFLEALEKANKAIVAGIQQEGSACRSKCEIDFSHNNFAKNSCVYLCGKVEGAALDLAQAAYNLQYGTMWATYSATVVSCTAEHELALLKCGRALGKECKNEK